MRIYLVYYFNKIIKPKNIDSKPEPEKLRPIFWESFCEYFKKASKYLGWKETLHRSIDCANGVGGKIMPFFN